MTKTRNKAVKATIVVAALLMVGPAMAQVPAVPTDVSATVPFSPLVTVYAEDFEMGDGGFTTGGVSSWAFGEAVSPPSPAVGQGPTMWATNIAGDYGNGECGYLQSTGIDLSGFAPAPASAASLARLAFRHWIHVENRYDAGIVQASVDGGATWAVLTPLGGYPSTVLASAQGCFGITSTDKAYTYSTTPAADAWNLAEFDITPLLGNHVQVRWVFASDGSVVKRGWYVDDILVQVGAGASVATSTPGASGVQVPFTAVQTLYADDFEGSDGGWTPSGTEAWEWGTPASPPTPLTGSLNMWGTHLNGGYDASECAYVTSPSIAIPGASASAGVQAARLTAKVWRHTETSMDGAVLQTSVDGGATWQRLATDAYDGTLSTSSTAAATRACLGVSTTEKVWVGPSAQPKEDDWLSVSADLTHLMGKTIQLRFALGADTDGGQRGIYFDDVLVQVGAGASAAAAVPQPGSMAAPGWTVTGTNPSWAYGVPTTGPASQLPVFATNLGGQHNPSECSAIVSPPIVTSAVPGLGQLKLTFEHYFDTVSSDDGGVVQVSRDDGLTWTTVTPVGGYGGTLGTSARNCLAPGATAAAGFVTNPTGPAYVAREVNLGAFQGETIRIRFAFGAGTASHDFGWYVRNVDVTRGVGSVPVLLSSVDIDRVLEKADPALAGLVLAGHQGPFRVLVAGTPHEGVADLGFQTRAEYTAWFEAKSAPLLSALRAIAAADGAPVAGEFTILPGIAATLSLDALVQVAAHDDVDSITLDSDKALQLIEPIPDDSVETSNTQGRKQLQAEDVWALGYKGAGIRLVIIDTGIVGNHEAFKFADGSSRIEMFVDCQSGTCNAVAPYDDHGHGTHVAGSSVGSALYNDPTHGYFQETGVAPEATLLGAKFLSGSGSGSFAAGVASIQWSFNTALADITSNSWGASGCSSSAHPVMAAVRTTTDAGMLNVFAAGNSGPGSSTIGSPGCSESALTIGAIDNNKVIASFSSRGPCADTEIGGPSRICPDVVAKGVAVRSAIPRSGAGNADPSGYKTWQGTSMATPHAAGAVALAEQMKRAITGTGWDTAARAEEQVFKMTALDLGAAGEDSTYGWGLPQLLNIYAMLNATDEANVLSTFSISRDTVRQGDSTLLSFGVRNLGGATATGDFIVELEDPNGDVVVLDSATVALGLLDGRSFSTSFVVGSNVLPGTYTFRGSFDYTWTNAQNEVVTGSILHTGSFDVKRVFVQVTLEGLDAATTPGDVQQVRFTARNIGNENANNVTIEFTVPDDYVFVPGANFDPANANSRYADPAPKAVKEDSNFGRVTLTFDVGSLAEGAEFSFTTNLVPTTPGDYRVLSVTKFKDGGNNGFTQGSLSIQRVGLPSA